LRKQLPKHNSIAQLLFATRKISREDYESALHECQETGKAPHEILFLNGSISMDELVRAAQLTVERNFSSAQAPVLERGDDPPVKTTSEIYPKGIMGDSPETRLHDIIGESLGIQQVKSLIRKVAPTKATVLICGESGTGKELVARAIHWLSTRADSPMISLNCSAVPQELVESELFGHKKGSFSGSTRDHSGVFRAAHRGTLFLDEIEATSPAMQVKLLRAIQFGEIRPVGEVVFQQVDVRFIVATNQNLSELALNGFFREDLLHRINVFQIVLPPLRNRSADIPLLAAHFLDRYAKINKRKSFDIDPAALHLLVRYPWPGNIREMENEIERACILTGDGSTISVSCVSPRITSSLHHIEAKTKPRPPSTLKGAIEDMERKMVREALETYAGNRTLAAKRLGLSRQGLLNKIHKFKLDQS
jgi:transcriptional regulator with PAS, ATPase and Fis domain